MYQNTKLNRDNSGIVFLSLICQVYRKLKLAVSDVELFIGGSSLPVNLKRKL